MNAQFINWLEKRKAAAAGGGLAFFDFVSASGDVIVDTGVYLPSLGVLYIQAYATASFGEKGVAGAIDGNGGSTYISLRTSGGSRRWTCVYDGGASSGRNGGALNSRLYCCLTPYRFFGSSAITNLTKGSTTPATTLKLFNIGIDTPIPQLGIGPVYVYGSDAKDVTSIAALDSFTPVATILPCKFGAAAGFWYVENDSFIGNTGAGSLNAFNI